MRDFDQIHDDLIQRKLRSELRKTSFSLFERFMSKYPRTTQADDGVLWSAWKAVVEPNLIRNDEIEGFHYEDES